MFADYNGISIEPMWSGYHRDTGKHFQDADQANAWHCWGALAARHSDGSHHRHPARLATIEADLLGIGYAAVSRDRRGQPETGAINEQSVVAISGLPIAFVATLFITS